MDHLTKRVQLALQQFKRSMEADFLQKIDLGITGPQIFMLYSIFKRHQCKLAQLAELMDVKPSAITVMIDRLEKPGYVRRVPDPADRRATWVELTDAGKEILDQAIDKRNEILQSYLTRLETEEVEVLAQLLEKLTGTTGDSEKDERSARGN